MTKREGGSERERGKIYEIHYNTISMISYICIHYYINMYILINIFVLGLLVSVDNMYSASKLHHPPARDYRPWDLLD